MKLLPAFLVIASITSAVATTPASTADSIASIRASNVDNAKSNAVFSTLVTQYGLLAPRRTPIAPPHSTPQPPLLMTTKLNSF